MSADKIGLWRGIQVSREKADFSVMDIYRDSDRSIKVKLSISVDGEEQYPALGVGETFPVGDETWQLAELTGWPSEDDWLVVLHRVTNAPA
ncbi:DUF6406 domain-containing protein [Streptomyces sp. NPDC102384]|uniref:DUF6406 domain-containing protein n=1 Tax=Streptomyces sp. NPDC102384 TaxID=3366166 RepID=UPI0038302C89